MYIHMHIHRYTHAQKIPAHAATCQDDPKKGETIGDSSRGYHKKRIPSYTDRVLTLHAPGKPVPSRVAQGAAHAVSASDHAPVWGIFDARCLLQTPPLDELDFEEQVSGNQRQSAAISGNRWQSVAISGNRWQSVV